MGRRARAAPRRIAARDSERRADTTTSPVLPTRQVLLAVVRSRSCRSESVGGRTESARLLLAPHRRAPPAVFARLLEYHGGITPRC